MRPLMRGTSPDNSITQQPTGDLSAGIPGGEVALGRPCGPTRDHWSCQVRSGELSQPGGVYLNRRWLPSLLRGCFASDARPLSRMERTGLEPAPPAKKLHAPRPHEATSRDGHVDFGSMVTRKWSQRLASRKRPALDPLVPRRQRRSRLGRPSIRLIS